MNVFNMHTMYPYFSKHETVSNTNEILLCSFIFILKLLICIDHSLVDREFYIALEFLLKWKVSSKRVSKTFWHQSTSVTQRRPYLGKNTLWYCCWYTKSGQNQPNNDKITYGLRGYHIDIFAGSIRIIIIKLIPWEFLL